MNKTAWETEATNMLRAEMSRRGISYADLRTALQKVGIEKSEGALRNMVTLGKFQFAFFLQCAKAIGLTSVSFTLD